MSEYRALLGDHVMHAADPHVSPVQDRYKTMCGRRQMTATGDSFWASRELCQVCVVAIDRRESRVRV